MNNEKKNDDSKQKIDIFSPMVSTKRINVKTSNIGENIREVLSKILSKEIEGKCNKEGFIKKNSCNILKYSCGLLNGDSAKFDVVFECMVCLPVENMEIDCVAKNITKAGIRAEIPGYENSPVVIFIARDHNYNNKYFNSINENDNIIVKVIGLRFELNDKFISVIGSVINRNKQPKKINIKND